MSKNLLRLLGSSVVVFLLFLIAPSASAATYYVATNGNDSSPGTLASPFRTIEKARDTVRPLLSSMSSDITVYLRGGTYPLSSTLTFDASDSGQNGHNVIYSSYPGDTSPIVSGGTQISGWTSVGGGIYKANVGSLRFRQLYVNGQRATRARTPNTGNS